MLLPSFAHEKRLRKTGLVVIAGTDEAGSGAWAGPVFAGAVIFPIKLPRLSPLLRDSKLLSPTQRQQALTWITSHVEAWAVGEASAQEIDALNIRQAGFLAMQRAIEGLGTIPQLVLSDGFKLPSTHPWPSEGIVKGDRLIASISAASIIAKVMRDRHLTELDKQFPGYGFSIHKGYGTLLHRNALKNLGLCPVHRVSYKPVRCFYQE